jgi:putative peptidoglycan lipid II flippase
MNKLLKKANTRISLGGAAALLSASSLIGAVLGIVRTSLINANFPGGAAAPYFAAFKIPDFIFFALASGALGVAFLPVLSDKLNDGERAKAWELSSSILNFLALLTGLMAIIMIIFAEPLLKHIVVPNFTPDELHVAAKIMRLISINPLIFAISSVFTTVQQAVGRFFFYALAPLFYNAAIVLSVVLFSNDLGLAGIGYGVLVGAVLQLGMTWFGMSGLKFKYYPGINWKDKNFRQVMKALPARSIDQGIDYINAIVETRFAGRLGSNYISYYENAFLLHTQPIALIGIAISTAAFPRFTERLSQGRPDLFRKEFLQVLKAMIWIAMPVVVISFFSKEYLARMIFKQDSKEIAIIFGYLVVAIFFRTLYTIISRYFYAQKDTKTPLFVSLFAIGLNIFLAYNLSRQSSYGVAGLAIAQSTVALSEVCILFLIMLKRDHRLFDKDFWSGIFRIVSVSGFTGIAAMSAVWLFPLQVTDRGITLLVKLSLIGTMSIVAHLVMSWVFRIEEALPVVAKLKKIILKPVKIQ